MAVPSVSIIIPTFNRLHFLREALDSIVAQTFSDWEVIVVDDGSTEDIGGGIANHACQPRVFRQPRQGPAAARNRGLAEARAPVVAFLDSDDLWEPNKLRVFFDAMQATPGCNIFYGPMLPIDESGRPVAGRTKPCQGGNITEALFCSSFVHVPTVVARREILERARGFDASLPVCEDYDLWLRISVHEAFGLIDQPLARRRLHGDRLSKQSMCRNLCVKSRVLQHFYESRQANGQLSDDVARDRLARVMFVAARAAFRDGRFQQAAHLARESRRYGGSALRAMPLLWSAGTLAMLRREPEEAQLQPTP